VYAPVVILPRAPDLGLLLVRTDYSDDEAWHAALSAATAVYAMDDFERMGALLQPVESSDLSNLTPEDLVALPRGLPKPDRSGGRANDAGSNRIVRGLQRTE